MQVQVRVPEADVDLERPARPGALPEAEAEEHRMGEPDRATGRDRAQPAAGGIRHLEVRRRHRIEVQPVPVGDDRLGADGCGQGRVQRRPERIRVSVSGDAATDDLLRHGLQAHDGVGGSPREPAKRPHVEQLTRPEAGVDHEAGEPGCR